MTSLLDLKAAICCSFHPLFFREQSVIKHLNQVSPFSAFKMVNSHNNFHDIHKTIICPFLFDLFLSPQINSGKKESSEYTYDQRPSDIYFQMNEIKT